MIAQQSIHFALQMNWILVAAMEDYQPENDVGRRNPTANAKLYLRCATLQHNLERSVVFGSPKCSEYERLYSQGKLTKAELQELELQDRKKAAAEFVEEGKQRGQGAGVLESVLKYKRWQKHWRFGRLVWRERKFRVMHRVLLCYRVSDGALKRAIPLAHTDVAVLKDPEGVEPYYFELRERKRDRVYKLSAPDEATMNQWVTTLRAEAAAPPSHLPANLNTTTLSESQIARYGFYRSERDFVRNLTDICEDLRFVDRSQRKPELRTRLEMLEVPGCVYLPMQRSTAPWFRVVKVLADKGHPFSTKARCPCLMTFEVVADGPANIDVANYLYQTLGAGAGADNGGGVTKAAGDWRKRFSQSAVLAGKALEEKKSATAGGNPAESDDTRMQIAFSDAAEADAPAARHAHSLWDNEDTPNAVVRKRVPLTEKKMEKRGEITNKAADLLKIVTGALPAIDSTADTSVAEAMAQATEDQKQAHGTDRTKSMARAAGPSQGPTLDRIIAKSNDDLRQEVFTMQLMQFLKDTWATAGLPLYLRTYRILSTSKNTGLLEVITNADSIDGVKKKLGPGVRFVQKFRELFPEEASFAAAQRAYMESLAGSSIASFILRTGDRHNGNIMVEMEAGRLAHIDFGFVFGMRPGKDKVPHTDFSFERAPWKLTSEMVEVMGGKDSPLWDEYIKLMAEGLKAVRRQADTLLTLVEITGYKSMFPCFRQPGGGVARVLRELKARLMLDVADHGIEPRVRSMANTSYQHVGTILYEKFQLATNKIAPIY